MPATVISDSRRKYWQISPSMQIHIVSELPLMAARENAPKRARKLVKLGRANPSGPRDSQLGNRPVEALAGRYRLRSSRGMRRFRQRVRQGEMTSGGEYQGLFSPSRAITTA